MGWSTSELATLTGTTVNTIRHYHKLDLLAEPERMSNGYKQYGAGHLLRLLQIRRLREIGVPLSDIDSVDGDRDQQRSVLTQLESDLDTQIAELRRARDEVRQLLDHDAPIDTVAGFIDIAMGMSDSDRSLMSLYSRLFDAEVMAEMKSVMSESSPVDDEFDVLPGDADEEVRARMAELIAPGMKRQLEAKPWMLSPIDRMRGDAKKGQAAVIDLISEVYNEAQIDVIQRAFVAVFPTLDISADDRDRFIAFIAGLAGD